MTPNKPHTNGRVRARTQGTAQPESPLIGDSPPMSRPHPCNGQGKRLTGSTAPGSTAPPLVTGHSVGVDCGNGEDVSIIHRIYTKGGGGFLKCAREGRWPLSYCLRYLQVRYGALLKVIANKARRLL